MSSQLKQNVELFQGELGSPLFLSSFNGEVQKEEQASSVPAIHAKEPGWFSLYSSHLGLCPHPCLSPFGLPVYFHTRRRNSVFKQTQTSSLSVISLACLLMSALPASTVTGANSLNPLFFFLSFWFCFHKCLPFNLNLEMRYIEPFV